MDPSQGGASVPRGAFAHFTSALAPDPPLLTVAFDQKEELVWTGSAVGRLSSHYSTSLSKHTAWQPHNCDRPDVRQLDASLDGCVLALYADALRACARTGMPLSVHRFPPGAEMSSMVACRDNKEHLLAAGFGKTAVRFDANVGKVVRQVELDSDCALMCANDRFTFFADSAGKVVLRDPRTLTAAHTFEAHKGAVSDMDARGPLLVTAGCSYQSYVGQAPTLASDRFLMVYDVRVMRAQTPVTTLFEPAFVKFVPTYSDRRLVIVSQAGDFSVFELGESAAVPYRVDLGGAPLCALAVSQTRQCVAFADAAGWLHLFTDRLNAVFNENSWPTVFAQIALRQVKPKCRVDKTTQPPAVPMRVDDALAPLAVVPTPFPANANADYCSDMPARLCNTYYREPSEMSERVLSSMRQIDFVGYAQNVDGRRPNQVP